MTENELEIAVRAHERRRQEMKESIRSRCIATACSFVVARGGYSVWGVDNRGNLSQSSVGQVVRK